jgi:very-short-patch-repair endonuclease
MLTKKQETSIIKKYRKGLSTYAIAKQYDTYANKIRRILIRNGEDLRDKSKAQKIALKDGRSQHPTEGKSRSEKTKEQISESVHKHWKKLSEVERQKRVDKARKQWYNMTVAEREALHNLAAAAVREASKSGSKIEQFLRDSLRKNGYEVIFHKKGLIANVDLEVDLFLPILKTVIEIDGPTHFFPIWGEDKLQRHIKSDADKMGLLLSKGMVIIRVKHIVRNMSNKYQRDLLKHILQLLSEIKNKFPTKPNRYIEVEINT